jgi:hypothetical protein
MPPAPKGARISYGPRRVPGDRIRAGTESRRWSPQHEHGRAADCAGGALMLSSHHEATPNVTIHLPDRPARPRRLATVVICWHCVAVLADLNQPEPLSQYLRRRGRAAPFERLRQLDNIRDPMGRHGTDGATRPFLPAAQRLNSMPDASSHDRHEEGRLVARSPASGSFAPKTLIRCSRY